MKLGSDKISLSTAFMNLSDLIQESKYSEIYASAAALLVRLAKTVLKKRTDAVLTLFAAELFPICNISRNLFCFGFGLSPRSTLRVLNELLGRSSTSSHFWPSERLNWRY